jgi:hypothetical protein
MRTVERLVDCIWKLGFEADFEDEQILQDKAVRFNFLLWDHTAFGVGMGCFECDDSVFVLMNYTSTSDGTLRLFRGEAWTSDASKPSKNQRKADMTTAMQFLGAMRNQKELSVYVVFDGQMEVEKNFDLHLNFEHSIQKRSLLVRNVFDCDNPLTVIDRFK